MTVEMPQRRETLNSSQQSLESGVTGAKPFYPNQNTGSDTNSNKSEDNDFIKDDPDVYDKIGSVKDQLYYQQKF